jgi:hypothetical protein
VKIFQGARTEGAPASSEVVHSALDQILAAAHSVEKTRSPVNMVEFEADLIVISVSRLVVFSSLTYCSLMTESKVVVMINEQGLSLAPTILPNGPPAREDVPR